MKSIGIILEPYVNNKCLIFHATRASQYGLELHLASMIKLVHDVNPSIVVIDPMSNLVGGTNNSEAIDMLTRLLDYIKSHGITALFTCLIGGEAYDGGQENGISSLMDTWIAIKNYELNGERNRSLSVIKSRGTAHTNQIREFILSNSGIRLLTSGTKRLVPRRDDACQT